GLLQWDKFCADVTYQQDTNITFKLLNASDNSPIPGFDNIHLPEGGACYDISSLSTSYNSIKLFAKLTTNNDQNTPTLHEWNISWVKDTIPPNITIYLPENKTYNHKTNIPLNYTVSDEGVGVDTCWYSVDGGANQTLPNCQNTTFSVATDGTHYVTVYANDTAGNVNSSTRYFSVDSTPPNISIQLPEDKIYDYKTNLPLNYTVTDNFDVDTCWYSVDGGANQTLPNCQNTTFDVTTDGSHYVTVYANDTAGNVNSSTRYFYVDSHAPRYSQIQINETEPVIPGTPVEFSVFWNDTFDGFSSNLSHWIFSWTGEQGQCGVWVNKSPVAFGNVAEAWSNHSEVVHCTPSFKWKIYANDSVGHWNVTPEQEVITDNLPIVEKPRTYSESLVEKTSFEQNEKVVIRVNVTDPDGAEQIDKVLINITSANGSLVVENAEMVNVSSITNGYVFEYNYTLTNLLSNEFGTWQIDVFANDTYSQSDSNSSTFEVINTPPSLEGIFYECEDDCGWGEKWTYKVNLTEPNNNTVNVSFWYSYDGLTWVYKNSEVITCPPSGCYDIVINFSYDPGWQASDVGTRYFKFNASDGAGGTNETSQSVLVQKDDAIAVIINGSDVIARRWGEEKALFRIRINDTDRNVWVEEGVNCTFYFTKNGLTYSASLENQTDSLGYCSIYLKPDCSYSVGAQHWKGGITDSAYKLWNTTEQNYSVKGRLVINIESPSENEILHKT
ncbi:MAG: hypothetical protein DRP08_07290, partial [Candidatus Aenigmatarchaeota archaeon]